MLSRRPPRHYSCLRQDGQIEAEVVVDLETPFGAGAHVVRNPASQ